VTAAAPYLSNLEEQVHRSLSDWYKPAAADAPLGDSLSVQQQLPLQQGHYRRAINQVLQQGIQALGADDPDGANLLKLHYIDGKTAAQIAKKLNVVDQTVFKTQREKIKVLTAWFARQEEQLYQERIATFVNRLERPTYNHLIGVDSHLAQLERVVNAPTAPWLVALEGLGGVGKTTLADALMRRAIAAPQWADFAWVTARQQVLNLGGGLRPIDKPALNADALIDALYHQLHPVSGGPIRSPTEKRTWLQQQMKAKAHLVVIDNLETVTDVTALLATLHDLSNPSKFILTTRYSHHEEADHYHFPVPQLAAAAAFALLREEARQRNLPALAAAPDDELQPIYAAVGGNPLALRLVAGQTHTYSLGAILDHLRHGRTQSVENLYTYLYRTAWDSLDETARRTLLLMPLVQEEGEELAYLLAMGKVGNLDETALLAGLHTLVARNLVDSRGGLHDRRYTIHNLTRTFLQEQVLRW
jgi:hypothetical protein